MSAASLYPVRPEVATNTLTDEATYKAMYQHKHPRPSPECKSQKSKTTIDINII